MKKQLLIALMTLGLSAVATAQTYVPAGFGEDTLDYLQQAVIAPELNADLPVASIYCQADVGTDGLTRNLNCYEREGFDQLRDQVEEALIGRAFTPATVNGENVPVRMIFRVVYADVDGQPPVMMLPNLGHMQGDLGYHYVAPQERLDDNNWYERYRSNDWSRGQPFFGGEGRPTRVMAHVNTEGQVTSVRRIEAHGRNKRDAVEVEKTLKQSEFIPGFVNGSPEPMRYFAVLHYPD
ncbi:MAG TPA: hypothetical protein VIC08_02690 [Cellvibrionaceae bacterium]